MAFSERGFVRQLQKLPVRPPVQVGIGDDGAVIDCRHVSQQVVVTDMLVDQVHFDVSAVGGYDVGFKSVAVNLSDLAAMAAYPTAAFLSLAIPRTLTTNSTFLDRFYQAVSDLAQTYGFTVAGGDTNRIDGPLVVNVCLTGVPMSDAPILRSGAQAGDLLAVTGPLGGSFSSGRHLKPTPRLEQAEWCVKNLGLHAMMDLTDGLALDLHRMMEQSSTGAVLFANQIPIHSDVPCDLPDAQRREHALSDGEDFELLLALDPESLPSATPAGIDLTVIGRVRDQSNGVKLQTTVGETMTLPESGFQHM